MYFHANIETQLKEIFLPTIVKPFRGNDVNDLYDITDGKIYKSLLASENGELFKNRQAFTFILNTDGISLCTKSNLTMWPFYLAINEIQKEDRFLINNVVLAGSYKLNLMYLRLIFVF